MKISKYIVPLCLCGTLALQSCEDFLDSKPKETYSDDLIWGSASTADAFIVNSYNNVMGHYHNFQTLDFYTTNAVKVRGGTLDEVRELKTREWDWGFGNFGAVRACNLIIEKSQASPTLSDANKKQFVAEGKMMRAMLYFDQAKRCGRFIWVDRVMTQDEEFNLPLTPNIKDSYNKILSDVNDAIAGLPETALAGRMTKNAARALKSEICLTAAAYTGQTELYQQAIDAVDAITGKQLDANYGGMFNQDGAYSSPEIILARYYSKETNNCSGTVLIGLIPNVNNGIMTAKGHTPLFKTDYILEGWMETAPSQNLVDDYLVIDQLTNKAVRWNESSQFKNNTRTLTMAEVATTVVPVNAGELVEGQSLAYASTNGSLLNELMYQHRDKRFYANIVYDGCEYFGESITMRQKGNLHRTTTNSFGNDHVPLSNYAWRKGVYNVSPRPFFNVPTDYHYVIFRYGRALLNKAEALLCQAKSDASKIPAAMTIINQVRATHGGLSASEATTLAQAWSDYKCERHADLAFEGDYYWSLLRWGKYGYEANHGKAPDSIIDELNRPATFPEISVDRQQMYIGNVGFNNDQREFNPRRYLFPIPQSQINANSAISDKDQNPGW